MPWEPLAEDFFTADQTVDEDDLNAINNSVRHLEIIEVVLVTSPLSVTATTEATAQTYATLSAHTLTATLHCLKVYVPTAVPQSAANLHLWLYDSSTSQGRLAEQGGSDREVIFLEHFFTPSAASHTYSVRAHTGSGTASLTAGAGGAGNYVNGYVALFRVPS